jgi:hypothetical protein
MVTYVNEKGMKRYVAAVALTNAGSERVKMRARKCSDCLPLLGWQMLY